MPLTRSSKQYKVMQASRRRRRAETCRLKRTLDATTTTKQSTSKKNMSLACLVHHSSSTVIPSKRLLGTKRVYSETEESGESEEETWKEDHYSVNMCPGGIPYVFDSSLAVFLHLMDDEVISNFLWTDACAKLSDRYLLAMVYVYFKRASLSLEEYTRYNFFVGLYLANDMEEDDEDEKYEIFPWILGKDWICSYSSLLSHRDRLWSNMGFRAVVSKKTCDEVFSLAPDHRIWKRHRLSHHGGALRSYMKRQTSKYGRSSPKYCHLCSEAQYRLGSNSFWLDYGQQQKFDLLDDIDYSHKLCVNQDPLSHPPPLSTISFNLNPVKEE